MDASYETTGDSKSRYGIAEYFGEYGAAFTQSKKISRVTHHPPEAEAVGIVEAIKKAIWIIEFNEELRFKRKGLFIIYTDSQATIDTTADVGTSEKTKYYHKRKLQTVRSSYSRSAEKRTRQIC